MGTRGNFIFDEAGLLRGGGGEQARAAVRRWPSEKPAETKMDYGGYEGEEGGKSVVIYVVQVWGVR